MNRRNLNSAYIPPNQGQQRNNIAFNPVPQNNNSPLPPIQTINAQPGNGFIQPNMANMKPYAPNPQIVRNMNGHPSSGFQFQGMGNMNAQKNNGFQPQSMGNMNGHQNIGFQPQSMGNMNAPKNNGIQPPNNLTPPPLGY